MISGRIGCELAVVAAFCVLSIFLFPCVQGPYSTVHGPVTALQAVRAAARLRLAILAAALTAFSNSQKTSVRALFKIRLSGAEFRLPRFSDLSSILRC
ncbi:MAG: hypothetical protein WAU58_17665 [Terriglobales bacterium]|jgi:hypothetical protein